MDNNQLAIKTYNRISKIYTNQYFSDVTDYPFIDKFLALLTPQAKILDAGCGPGQHTKYLLEKGYEVEGIDLSEKMIEQAIQKVPNGKFQIMDMRKMSFEDESYDAIIAAYSLIHVSTVEIVQTLKEFARILRPNGHLLVLAQKGEPDKITQEPLKSDELMFVNFFTQERLTSLLRNASFSVTYITEKKIKDSLAMADTVICAIAQKN